MIIGDETNIYDLLLTENGKIVNFVDFLKSIEKSDMNENVVNQDITLNYDIDYIVKEAIDLAIFMKII